MTGEMVTREGLSAESLKSVFESAFLDAQLDSDGDLFVRDGGVGCYVYPSESGQEIRFAAYANPKGDPERDKRLEFANRANEGFKLVRTSLLDSGRFVFDYWLPLDGGMTRKAIVYTLRRFVSITPQILNDCDKDGLFD